MMGLLFMIDCMGNLYAYLDIQKYIYTFALFLEEIHSYVGEINAKKR